MKRILKSIVSISLCIVMVFSVIPLTGMNVLKFEASADEITEETGDIALSYTVDDNYLTVVISNAGIEDLESINIDIYYESSELIYSSFKWSDYIITETTWDSRAYNSNNAGEIRLGFYHIDCFSEANFEIAEIKFEITDATNTCVKVKNYVYTSSDEFEKEKEFPIILKCSHVDKDNDSICDNCNADFVDASNMLITYSVENNYLIATIKNNGIGSLESINLYIRYDLSVLKFTEFKWSNYLRSESYGYEYNPEYEDNCIAIAFYHLESFSEDDFDIAEIKFEIISDEIASTVLQTECSGRTSIDISDEKFKKEKSFDIELICSHVDEDFDCICDKCSDEIEINGVLDNSDIKWTYTNGKLEVSGNGKITDFEETADVPWDRYKTKIEKIVIDNGITSVGAKAFAHCTVLKDIFLADSITEIAYASFANCSELQNITLPKSLKSIGEAAFSDCSELIEITIPDSVKSLGNSVFKSCVGLKNVQMTDAITEIGSGAFYGCEKLENIKIPGLVKEIEDETFFGCINLSSIVIPENITRIGEGAFHDCKSLTEVVLPETLTSIERYAFGYCSEIKEIIIPGTVKTLYYGTFASCSKLENVIIKEGVEVLENAFNECNAINKIILPDSLKNIDEYVFHDSAFYNNKDNWKNGELYINNHLMAAEGIKGDYVIKSGTLTVRNCSSNKEMTSVTIPSSVTVLQYYSFSDCNKLENINLPDTLVKIDNPRYVFDRTAFIENDKNYENGILYSGKYLLLGKEDEAIWNSQTKEYEEKIYLSGEITIKDGIKYICRDAFRGCEHIAKVNLPDSVEYIGSRAFIGLSLQEIVLPESVSLVEKHAFYDYYYSGNRLEKITVLNPEAILEDEFVNESTAIYGYENSTADTYAKENGNKFVSIGEYNPHSHSYVEKITKVATCTENGTNIFTCSCGDSYTESVAALGHSFSTSFTVDKEATCTAEGSKSKHCTRSGCSEKTEVTAIAKLAHTYTSKITAQPTCAKEGVKTFTCVCGNSYTEAIAKLEHKYTSKITTQPTCAKEGVKTFTCSCGNSYTEAIAKLATHTWGAWKVTKAATYEAEGREERSCSVCKKTEGRVISKLEYKEIEIPVTEEVKPLGEDAVLVLSDASVGEIIKNTKGNVSVTDKDGKAVSEKDSVASGMTVTLKDASGKVIDEKTIVVPGDNNGDGKITAADARSALRASVSLDKLNTWQNSASNVDKMAENKITAADARFILRASVNLENFKDWLETVK